LAGRAVVSIDVSWKLIDKKSDRQVYHHYEGDKPAYIRYRDGDQEVLVPWLSLENDNNTNQPIGGNTSDIFERKGLTTKATNWLNVVVESHSHLNR
jgi:hypothetical protein